MKKILVPCDFSTTAQQAYTFALDLARKTDGEILVLRVIDIPFMYESYSPTVPAYLNPEVWTRLVGESTDNFKKMKSSNTTHEKVSLKVIEGPVTLTILDAIQKEHIDLVVMGTKGATGMDEFLIGSNTERIVRMAKVPVLAVRKAVNISSIKNIVVPTILLPDQEEFFGHLRDLQSVFGATLHLLAINSPFNFKRSKYEQKELQDYANQYHLKDYTLNIRAEVSEERGILTFAEETHADMIAMATHGRSGVAHLFMGSLTEDIVNHAQYPIWTCSIHPEHEMKGTGIVIEESSSGS